MERLQKPKPSPQPESARPRRTAARSFGGSGVYAFSCIWHIFNIGRSMVNAIQQHNSSYMTVNDRAMNIPIAPSPCIGTFIPGFRKSCLIASTLFSACSFAQTHSLPAGWDLIGIDSASDVNSIAVFGNAVSPTSISASVISVWSWDSTNKRWNFFAPSMTPEALSAYATSHGYGVLSALPKGKGVWVNSSKALTLNWPPPTVSLTSLVGTDSYVPTKYTVSGAGCAGLGATTGSYSETMQASASASGSKLTFNIWGSGSYYIFTLDYQSGDATSGFNFSGTFRETVSGLSGTATALSLMKPYSGFSGFVSGIAGNCTIAASLS